MCRISKKKLWRFQEVKIIGLRKKRGEARSISTIFEKVDFCVSFLTFFLFKIRIISPVQYCIMGIFLTRYSLARFLAHFCTENGAKNRARLSSSQEHENQIKTRSIHPIFGTKKIKNEIYTQIGGLGGFNHNTRQFHTAIKRIFVLLRFCTFLRPGFCSIQT